MYEALTFSYDWNHKLYCDVFTTFRVANNQKYCKGAKRTVYLRSKNGLHTLPDDEPHRYDNLGDVEIIEVAPYKLSQVNQAVALIDSGYPLIEFLAIVRKMYPKYIEQHGDQALFVLAFCKYIKKHDRFEEMLNKALTNFTTKLQPLLPPQP